ncbi:hypothetical protein H8356DRAFT_1356730 [Neocallimastix lanati (nom. inval.)]|nr:hypothetical protein H8356DRAFT_1356730 [Neocallimastix sp. JGI-2020a]
MNGLNDVIQNNNYIKKLIENNIPFNVQENVKFVFRLKGKVGLRAPVHQLQLDSKENRTISSVIHDDSENDDVTNDSDLFEGSDDNPNNNKKISSLIKLINTMIVKTMNGKQIKDDHPGIKLIKNLILVDVELYTKLCKD